MSKDVLDLLDARAKGWDLDPSQFSYKLGTNTSQTPTFGLDVPVVGDLRIDEGTMSLWIYVADGNRRDGVGDLLEVDGIDVRRHVRNPICLYDHGKEVTLPIARAREDPKDIDSYTFRIDSQDRTAGCRAYFYQGANECALNGSCQPGTHAAFCHELFHMAAKGFIGAGSIGYQVIDGTPLTPDYVSGLPQGLHLKKILALEFSLVVLPANMLTVGKSDKSLFSRYAPTIDYIRSALTGGRINGRQPSEYFRKAFEHRLPAKPAVVTSGFGLGSLQKAMKAPNYREAENPEKSCHTCQAYSDKGGLVGLCRMFQVDVSPRATCDRWQGKDNQLQDFGREKALKHGPDCTCEKCMAQYGTKSHGGHCCSACAEGKSCTGSKELPHVHTKAESGGGSTPKPAANKPTKLPPHPKTVKRTKQPAKPAPQAQPQPQQPAPQAQQQATPAEDPKINRRQFDAATLGLLGAGVATTGIGAAGTAYMAGSADRALARQQADENQRLQHELENLRNERKPTQLEKPPPQEAKVQRPTESESALAREERPDTVGTPPAPTRREPERLPKATEEEFRANEAQRERRGRVAEQLGLSLDELGRFEDYRNMLRQKRVGGTHFWNLPIREQIKIWRGYERQFARKPGKDLDPLAWDHKSLHDLKAKYGDKAELGIKKTGSAQAGFHKDLPNSYAKAEGQPKGNTGNSGNSGNAPAPKPTAQNPNPQAGPTAKKVSKPINQATTAIQNFTPQPITNRKPATGKAPTASPNREVSAHPTQTAPFPREVPAEPQVDEADHPEVLNQFRRFEERQGAASHLARLYPNPDMYARAVMSSYLRGARADGTLKVDPSRLAALQDKIYDWALENWRIYNSGKGVGKSLPDASETKSQAETVHGNLYDWDTKSLGELRSRYKTPQGRFHRYRKGTPGIVHFWLKTANLDPLRKAAEGKGVEVHWVADDGKGACKVKLVGMDGVLEDLAKEYGVAMKKANIDTKAKKKALPHQSKAVHPEDGVTGPIGTVPGGSRERLTLDPDPERNQIVHPGNTRELPDLEHTPVLTAKGEKKLTGNKKAADDIIDEYSMKPEDGPFPGEYENGYGEMGPEGYTAGKRRGEQDFPEEMINTKAIGEDMGEGLEQEEELGGGVGNEESPYGHEPYGAQVTRRVHADHVGLLHEYDEMMHHLEDEKTKQLVIKILRGFVQLIEEMEEHFHTHPEYHRLPPLDGSDLAQQREQMGEGGEPVPEPGMEGMEGSGTGAHGAETGGVGASSRMEQEPTPDEALEGMRSQEDPEYQARKSLYYNHVKGLRAGYKHCGGVGGGEQGRGEGKSGGSAVGGEPQGAGAGKASGSAVGSQPQGTGEGKGRGSAVGSEPQGRGEGKSGGSAVGTEAQGRGKGAGRGEGGVKSLQQLQHEANYLRKYLMSLGNRNDPSSNGMRKLLIKRLMKNEKAHKAAKNQSLLSKHDLGNITGSEPGQEFKNEDGIPTTGSKSLPQQSKAQPSDKVSSKKACTILEDGEANGKPLTESQKRMFGAACGKND